MIENISAITLATHDMARAVRFYRMLGFELISLNAFAMRVPELWAGFSFWRMTGGSLVSAT